MGKTELALAYASRYFAEYDKVLWCSAESRTQMESGLLWLAHRLADQNRLILPDPQDSQAVLLEMKQWLANQSGQYLLILDNVEQMHTVVQMFEERSLRGHLLMTSRGRLEGNWDIDTPLELDVLDKSDAATFLTQRTGRNENDSQMREQALRLAEELGGLPLALEQVAAFLSNHTRTSMEEYRQDFLQRRLAVFPVPAGASNPEAKHFETVTTTWDKSIAVVKAYPGAEVLATWTSLCAPDPIPFAFAENASLGRKKLQPQEALYTYSLVEADTDARTYRMHRLLQEVIRARIPKATLGAYLSDVMKRWDEILPPPDLANWRNYTQSVSHLKALYERSQPETLHGHHVWELLFKAAVFLDESRRYATLNDEFADELDHLLEKHGAALLHGTSAGMQELAARVQEMPQIKARRLNHQSIKYYEEGRYAAAEPLIQQALEIQRASLPKGHLDIAMSLINLAILYRSQGRYAEAESLW